jgi:hypothetical protein
MASVGFPGIDLNAANIPEEAALSSSRRDIKYAVLASTPFKERPDAASASTTVISTHTDDSEGIKDGRMASNSVTELQEAKVINEGCL